MATPTRPNDLKNQLLAILTQFKQSLKLYYKAQDVNRTKQEVNRLAVQKLKSIFKDKTDVFDVYDAMLDWCQKNNEQDELKKSFIALNEKYFKDRLAMRAAQQAEIAGELGKQAMRLKKIYQDDMDRINHDIAVRKSYLEYLRQEASRIAELRFLPGSNFDQLQKRVRRLQELAGYLKRIPVPAPIVYPVQRDLPDSVLALAKTKMSVLQALEKDIQQYKLHLKNESIFTRFFKWFSPVRRAREAALKKYAELSAISDVTLRYQAVVRWGNDHADKIDLASRFYKNCIARFQVAHDQTRFETLPMLRNKNQQEINVLTETMQNTTVSHNAQITQSMKAIKNLETETAQIKNTLDEFLLRMDSVHESAFGYMQNDCDDVAASLNAVSSSLGLSNAARPLQEAHDIAQEISQLASNAPPEKMMQIKKRIDGLQKTQQAEKVIETSLNKVISDTQQHGGKGNNLLFMGTAQAAHLVGMLGSAQQKQTMHEAKQKAEKTAQQAFQQSEQGFVDTLSRAIDAGTYQETLSRWRDAYMKYKSKTNDTAAEAIYKNEIKPLRATVLRYNAKNQNLLKNLVDSMMSAAVDASVFTAEAKAYADARHLFSSENMDMFVQIYGTDEQIARWNNIVFPSIKNNATHQVTRAAFSLV